MLFIGENCRRVCKLRVRKLKLSMEVVEPRLEGVLFENETVARTTFLRMFKLKPSDKTPRTKRSAEAFMQFLASRYRLVGQPMMYAPPPSRKANSWLAPAMLRKLRAVRANVARQAVDFEVVGMAVDASRIGGVETLVGLLTFPDVGLATWAPPQAFFRVVRRTKAMPVCGPGVSQSNRINQITILCSIVPCSWFFLVDKI